MHNAYKADRSRVACTDGLHELHTSMDDDDMISCNSIEVESYCSLHFHENTQGDNLKNDMTGQMSRDVSANDNVTRTDAEDAVHERMSNSIPDNIYMQVSSEKSTVDKPRGNVPVVEATGAIFENDVARKNIEDVANTDYTSTTKGQPIHTGTQIYVVRYHDPEQSHFDEMSDRLIVKDITPDMSMGDLPTPSNWGTLDKAKDKVSWLLRLFRSDFFEMWVAVYYLHVCPDAGVRDYLCNQLFQFPIAKSEFYLPQLCRMCIMKHTEGDPVERFLVYQSARYVHFALMLLLDLETVIADENQPTDIYSYCVALRQRIIHQSARFNERQGYNEPPSLGHMILGGNFNPDINQVDDTLLIDDLGVTNASENQKFSITRSNLHEVKAQSGNLRKNVEDIMGGASSTAELRSTSSGFGMRSMFKRSNLGFKLTSGLDRNKGSRDATEGISRSADTLTSNGHVGELRKCEKQKVGSGLEDAALSTGRKVVCSMSEPEHQLIPLDRVSGRESTPLNTEYTGAKLSQNQALSRSSRATDMDMKTRETTTNKIDSTHRSDKEYLNTSERIDGSVDVDGAMGVNSLSTSSLSNIEEGRSGLGQDKEYRNHSFPALSTDYSTNHPDGDFYRLLENAESVNQHINGIPGNLTLTYYLGPEMSFLSSLTAIGERLILLSTREMRTAQLHAELSSINLNLPARVYMPLMVSSDSRQHHVVRIPPEESVILNSKDRVPFMILIEVLECPDLLTSELPKKSSLVESCQHSVEKTLDRASLPQDSVDISSVFDRRTAERAVKAEISKTGNSVPRIVPTFLSAQSFTRKQSLSQEETLLKSTSENHIEDLQYYEDSLTKNDTIDSANMQAHTNAITNTNANLRESGHTRTGWSTSFKTKSAASVEDSFASVARFRPLVNQVTRSVILNDDVVKLKEPWEIKRERVRSSSPYGHLPTWSVLSVIIKSGDDLRQDVLASQLLLQFQDIWISEKVDLWLRPVRAMITSNNSGVIETIHDAISIHSIKKHNNGSLYAYFVQEFGPVGCPRWDKAQYNFVSSMAAYSLISYFLQIKDRHNGNIMLTREGHCVHIDFGYFISSSPRNMGFESAPFKLTTEFVEVMGGVDSPGYKRFKDLIFIGFVTAKKHMENILVLIDIMQNGSDLPCFVAGSECRRLLKERFFYSETEQNLKVLVNGLIDKSLDAMSTVLYDNYQYYTNGIL